MQGASASSIRAQGSSCQIPASWLVRSCWMELEASTRRATNIRNQPQLRVLSSQTLGGRLEGVGPFGHRRPLETRLGTKRAQTVTFLWPVPMPSIDNKDLHQRVWFHSKTQALHVWRRFGAGPNTVKGLCSGRRPPTPVASGADSRSLRVLPTAHILPCAIQPARQGPNLRGVRCGGPARRRVPNLKAIRAGSGLDPVPLNPSSLSLVLDLGGLG